MVTIRPIDDPAPVLELFMRSDLEVAEDEFERNIFLKGYKAENEAGEIIGGCALTEQGGRYIVNGIAVDPAYRKTGLASDMLARVTEDARAMGAAELILVARAPGFFRKNGYEDVPEAEIPQGLFDCLTCPQYKSRCFPEVMRRKL